MVVVVVVVVVAVVTGFTLIVADNERFVTWTNI